MTLSGAVADRCRHPVQSMLGQGPAAQRRYRPNVLVETGGVSSAP